MRTSLHTTMKDSFTDSCEPDHVPVMVEEVIGALGCEPGGVYVDATLGLGGHALAILERIGPVGMLIGIDRDRDSLEIARRRLREHEGATRLFHENFKNLPLVLNNLDLKPVDGILVDLGISSYQLLSENRGFSFSSTAMLDMRMDRGQRPTAADLVNNLSQEQLAGIIYRYGEEKRSRRIAAAIVAARAHGPITRCAQLAEIVARAAGRHRTHGIHPATQTFQALRIAVNQELEGLEDFFAGVLRFLKPGGRIVAIAFHSLEDRIVKSAFRMLSGRCVCNRAPALCTCPRRALARPVFSRSRTPSAAEIASNPRSRSARLRALERI